MTWTPSSPWVTATEASCPHAVAAARSFLTTSQPSRSSSGQTTASERCPSPTCFPKATSGRTTSSTLRRANHSAPHDTPGGYRANVACYGTSVVLGAGRRQHHCPGVAVIPASRRWGCGRVVDPDDLEETSEAVWAPGLKTFTGPGDVHRRRGDPRRDHLRAPEAVANQSCLKCVCGPQRHRRIQHPCVHRSAQIPPSAA